MPFALYKSGIVVSLVTEVRGGEQPTFIPLLERALQIVPKLKLTVWDAGYVKAANSLYARFRNVAAHIEESAIETFDATGSHALAKKARDLDRQEMDMYPEVATRSHGIRQNAESGHSQMKRLWLALLRTRPYRATKRGQAAREKAGQDPEAIECKRKKDVSRRRGPPKTEWNRRNEVVLKYLVNNTYLLVRFEVYLRSEALKGLGANWQAWTPQGTPDWKTIRQHALDPHDTMRELVAKYAGDTKTVSDGIVAAAGGHIPMKLRSAEEAAALIA